jgi:hypothetical protein
VPPRIQNTTNSAGAADAIATIAAGSANPVGFIVGPIIAGGVFAEWVYGIYVRAHLLNPTFEYILVIPQAWGAMLHGVHHIMQMIFVISEARPDGVVKPEEVEVVLNRFEAVQCNDVHQEIREFIREMGVLKAVVCKDVVFEKIVNLIDHYRVSAEDNTSPVAPT